MELFTADWELAIDCELAGEGGGGARLSRLPLYLPLPLHSYRRNVEEWKS